MLYDPKWNAPSTDIFSLDSLIAWLEKQPAEQTYNFLNTAECALCQFARAMGAPSPRAGGNYIRWTDESPPIEIFRAGAGVIGFTPWTFGAALARAKAFRDQ